MKKDKLKTYLLNEGLSCSDSILKEVNIYFEKILLEHSVQESLDKKRRANIKERNDKINNFLKWIGSDINNLTAITLHTTKRNIQFYSGDFKQGGDAALIIKYLNALYNNQQPKFPFREIQLPSSDQKLRRIIESAESLAKVVYTNSKHRTARRKKSEAGKFIKAILELAAPKLIESTKSDTLDTAIKTHLYSKL